MINIKHEIFEDDIEELKVIDVQTFEREYSQIYGLFTINVGEHDFIPYPPDNIPLSAKGLFSELILTHYELLNEIVALLDTHNYVALKYIENAWTWLELKVENDVIRVSHLDYDLDNLPYRLDNLICTNENLLKGAKYGSFNQIPVLKKQFQNEVRNKTKLFVEEIKTINPILLQSKCFKHITR